MLTSAAQDDVNRDTRGRFAAGNPGGPGRKPAAQEQEYLALLRETVDLGEWRKAVLAVMAKAQEGSVRHFEAIAKLLLPTARQQIEFARPESETEFRIGGQSPEETHQEMLDYIRQEMQATMQREAMLRGEVLDVDRQTGRMLGDAAK